MYFWIPRAALSFAFFGSENSLILYPSPKASKITFDTSLIDISSVSADSEVSDVSSVVDSDVCGIEMIGVTVCVLSVSSVRHDTRDRSITAERTTHNNLFISHQTNKKC